MRDVHEGSPKCRGLVERMRQRLARLAVKPDKSGGANATMPLRAKHYFRLWAASGIYRAGLGPCPTEYQFFRRLAYGRRTVEQCGNSRHRMVASHAIGSAFTSSGL